MADTYDDLLRTRLQETGANRDTWGGLLNTDTLNLLAKAIAGIVTVPVAGTDVTLTTNPGAEDQARYAILEFTGAPGAARNIIIPEVSKIYVVKNDTGKTLTFTTDTGGETADVVDGARTMIMCDGADVFEIAPQFPDQASDSAALGGIPAAQWARLNVSQDFEGGQGWVPEALSMGASVTPDLDQANVFTGVLTADTTLQTPSNLPAAAAQLFFVHLQQATGSGPWDISFSNFYDFLGDAPTMPQDDGQSLLLQCLYLPGYGKAICMAIVEQTVGTVDLTLSHNENNVDVFRRAGSPAGVVTVNLVIEAGVIIHSHSTLEAALDLGGGFASGSVINITNLGYFIGKGGRGADGAWAHAGGDDEDAHGFGAGEDGGPAMRGAGAGVTINITNAAGRIWGGGGGGGAGGAGATNAGDTAAGIAVTGGGGGGAGMGQGGLGRSGKHRGNTNAVASANGANGRLNLDGSAAGGAAGSGDAAASGSAGASGAGGDYGAAGTNGSAASGDITTAATSGGAAGKAIDVNGSTVNFVSGNSSPNVKGAVS